MARSPVILETHFESGPATWPRSIPCRCFSFSLFKYDDLSHYDCIRLVVISIGHTAFFVTGSPSLKAAAQIPEIPPRQFDLDGYGKIYMAAVVELDPDGRRQLRTHSSPRRCTASPHDRFGSYHAGLRGPHGIVGPGPECCQLCIIK